MRARSVRPTRLALAGAALIFVYALYSGAASGGPGGPPSPAPPAAPAPPPPPPPARPRAPPPAHCPPPRAPLPYPAGVLARLAAADAARGDPPLLPLAIASFPHSGATWARDVLRAATGWDFGAADAGSPLGLADPFAVKTYFPAVPAAWEAAADKDARGWGMFARAIHLVRNPFDAIAAAIAFEDAWNANASLSADGATSRGEPRAVGGSAQFRAHMSVYERHHRYWARPPPLPSGVERRLVVRYEDMLSDPAGTFARIAEFVFDPRLREAAKSFLEEDMPKNASEWASPLDHPFLAAAGIDARGMLARHHAARSHSLSTSPHSAQALLASHPGALAPSPPELAKLAACGAAAHPDPYPTHAPAGDAVKLFNPDAVRVVVRMLGEPFFCELGYAGLLGAAGHGGLVSCP
ncbi:hypothetical protein DFJ74DRAFT_769248 [Hyaloraphidium curvatum]|nr:hypothetical protein DFJ74DRAFT_769248 [Hyaloraphidium curvatum]